MQIPSPTEFSLLHAKQESIKREIYIYIYILIETRK